MADNCTTWRMRMRTWHRDLGFLAIALTFVYALSGVALIFRGADWVMTQKQVERTLEPGLSAGEVKNELGLRQFRVQQQSDDEIVFAAGRYDRRSGAVSYTERGYIFPLNKFIELHTLSSRNPVHWFSVLYGVVLFFLALSSVWMIPPKQSEHRWRALVYVAVGVALTLGVLFAV